MQGWRQITTRLFHPSILSQLPCCCCFMIGRCEPPLCSSSKPLLAPALLQPAITDRHTQYLALPDSIMNGQLLCSPPSCLLHLRSSSYLHSSCHTFCPSTPHPHITILFLFSRPSPPLLPLYFSPFMSYVVLVFPFCMWRGETSVTIRGLNMKIKEKRSREEDGVERGQRAEG